MSAKRFILTVFMNCYKRNVIRLKIVDTSIYITLVTLSTSIFSIF